MQPTDEQVSIIETVKKSQSQNLMINALAGTGKTSTLEMIEASCKIRPILYLVFNKKNADEAEKRLQSTTTVRTFNSLGHRIWGAVIGRDKLKVAPRKTQEDLVEFIKSSPARAQGPMWECMWEVIAAVGFAKSLGYVPDGIYPNAKRLITEEDFHASLDEKPDLLSTELINKLLGLSIKAAYAGRIDYNDQIYMPALFGGTYPQFPLVMVDEIQDLNPVNHQMLRKLGRSRIIGVGDPWQCHPPGTMVRLTGGGTKRIEDVIVADQLVAYSPRAGRFSGSTSQGRKVLAVAKHDFEGDIIITTVDDRVTKMTPNHRVPIKINREATGHLLYLMCRNGQYRIGTSRVYYNGHSFGPALRARQEKADAVWLLGMFDSPFEAQVYEQYYSIEFQIPTTLFVSTLNQEGTDLFWELIGNNEDKALKILKAFGRKLEFPIWKISNSNFIGFHRVSVIQACNLITGLMNLLTYPKGTWEPVTINYESYKGPVYGLTVEPTEGGLRTYFSDNILVHNSIYGFRGAVRSGMSKLAGEFRMEELDLSTSFRCPQAIVEHVRWRVPHFKWVKEGGNVEAPKTLDPDSIPDDAAIISRNNAPLFSFALRLLGGGRSVSVAGSDIGPKLIGMMKKLGPSDLSRAQLRSAIFDWEARKTANNSKTAKDMAQCMLIFAQHGDSLGQAISYAEHLFKQCGSIRLLTGHKSKGLEFDCVYHLDQFLCDDSDQDLNLKYVIATRSANRLVEINSSDVRW